MVFCWVLQNSQFVTTDWAAPSLLISVTVCIEAVCCFWLHRGKYVKLFLICLTVKYYWIIFQHITTQCTVTCRQGRPLPMGQPRQSEQLAPPPMHKNLQKNQALQYCDRNEFIELTVDTSRVLMSKGGFKQTIPFPCCFHAVPMPFHRRSHTMPFC
jgi:hypothetical protein